MGKFASVAIFGDIVATDLVEVSTDARDLDSPGWWAVAQTFELDFLAFRFNKIHRAVTLNDIEKTYATNFDGVDPLSWTSSMSQKVYEDGVRSVQEDIASGWVYQVNLCRVLSSALPLDGHFDSVGLYCNLVRNNPAPYAGVLRVLSKDSGLDHDVEIISASPELYLGRNNDVLSSRPIKGTSASLDGFLPKDKSENIMIVDLVRNDMSLVSKPGSVTVPALLASEPHPGLFHLVSDVQGTLLEDVKWSDILQALSPAGSISGAPKSSALEVIKRLEKTPRNIYCGSFGWIENTNLPDNTSHEGALAVGIRTFWISAESQQKIIHFGTGAGITWDSDPTAEWEETELKARNLLKIASARYTEDSFDEIDNNSANHYQQETS